MKLYKRDYLCGFDENEQKQYNLALEKKNPLLYPIAHEYCSSLFPNNYISPPDLELINMSNKINKEFYDLIYTNGIKERTITKFIKENEYYHIVGRILKGAGIDVYFLLALFCILIHFFNIFNCSFGEP
jgi:hypothetical protein